MDIQFASARLERIFNSQQQLLKTYGKETVRKIRIRMMVLRSAPTLSTVPTKKPDRCHPLKGDRKGEYAVDLNHPFRLVFEPAGDPLPVKGDGSTDVSAVTVIRILRVEDYH
ncbi:type II toxin-antitoxin system RelE/ParE family toxin [Marispirochaeta sp.]|uniref:type II toxin-antitoxin system RelE/ParE family toxin n=1 Tax=Marispirochaeta sp. TaxID=2038653 RepID=UPI0029C8078B|nr:type II toxin-antitoxin system RelE/ParE family toxin [Marispirochaeta sp.]